MWRLSSPFKSVFCPHQKAWAAKNDVECMQCEVVSSSHSVSVLMLVTRPVPVTSLAPMMIDVGFISSTEREAV